MDVLPLKWKLTSMAVLCGDARTPLLQGSGEADFSGNPFGFMDEGVSDAIVNFPALFATEMSANRSADVLQYLLVSIMTALLLL